MLPWTDREVRDVAARNGPLLYLADTATGGLALLVADTIEVCWLPDLTTDELGDRVLGYLGALDARIADPHRFQATLDHVNRWLWTAVVGPVLERWTFLQRATIIPTGWLGLLPLHAAWTPNPDAPTGRRYALDDALLTYSPNARVLDAAARRRRKPAEDILVVRSATDSAAPPLPYAVRETDALATYFPRVRRLAEHEATVAAVLEGFENCGVAHFACHGFANSARPLESALILADGERLTLHDILAAHLPGVQFVTLSACETAMVGGVPDEVFSLAAGLLQSCAVGVVGSLWAVPDISTMLLMHQFYRLWRSDGFDRPEALRQAQRWLRDATNRDVADALPEVTELRPAAGGDFAELWQEARRYGHPVHWAAFAYTGA